MNEAAPKIIGVLILIGLLIGLIFGANSWKSSLRLEHITVDGNRIVSTNDILHLTQVQTGTLLYRADLSVIQQNVMSHYYIKDAVVKRSLPHTLSVHVTERTPIAMVNLPEPLYVDEEGVLLPRIPSRRIYDIPMISGISTNRSFIFGSPLTQPDEKEALQLLVLLKTVNRPLYFNISEVHIRDKSDLVLYSAEGGIPIIFGHGEVPEKILRLETFWNEIVRTKGVRDLQSVDLRYRDQIIARWTPGEKSVKTL